MSTEGRQGLTLGEALGNWVTVDSDREIVFLFLFITLVVFYSGRFLLAGGGDVERRDAA